MAELQEPFLPSWEAMAKSEAATVEPLTSLTLIDGVPSTPAAASRSEEVA